jgi:hypothetical protein
MSYIDDSTTDLAACRRAFLVLVARSQWEQIHRGDGDYRLTVSCDALDDFCHEIGIVPPRFGVGAFETVAKLAAEVE